MRLTEDDVKFIFQRNLHQDFIRATIECFDKYAESFNINRNIDFVRFMAQAVSEIQFVKLNNKRYPRTSENLNFSDEVLFHFSRYWREHKEELKEVRKLPKLQQQAIIINKWYPDGVDFIGHGAFMVTGRDNTIKCLKHIEDKTSIQCFRNNDIDWYLFQRLDIFWLLGFAYWDIHKMYECKNTNECTNIINRGLPKKYKKKRVKIALRLLKRFG